MRLVRAATAGVFLVACSGAAAAQPNEAAYKDALSLRERTMYLTDGVADAAV